MDKISIQGIACQARVGVSEKERAAAQKVVMDVVLFLDLQAAANTDDFHLTVDYLWVVEQIQKTASVRQFCLLEALAQSVCSALLEAGRIDSIQVTARKFPAALEGKAESVTVEITRRR